MEAHVFINGSINKTGGTIRINAQLINSKTEEAFKSFQINGTSENIFQIIDSLSVLVKNYLIVSILKKEVPPDIQKFGATLFPVSYRYFIKARYMITVKRIFS